MSPSAESPGSRGAAGSRLFAMRVFARRRIGRTLLTSFLVLTLVPLVLVAGVGLLISFQTAQANAYARLAAVADLRREAIQDWLAARQHDLQLLASEPETVDYLRTALSNPDNIGAIDSAASRLKVELLASQTFARLFVIDSRGKSIISTDNELLGTDHADQPYMQPLRDEAPFVTMPFVPDLNAYQIVIAVPIFNRGGYVIGVLVTESNVDQLAQIVLIGARQAATDDSYLVGQDFHFLTPTRFYHKSNTLHTVGVSQALSGPDQMGGQGIYDNYNGISVVGVYRMVPGLGIVLLTEQYTSEAFAGAQQQFLITLSLALLAGVFAVLGAYLVTRRIARPIVNLTATATRIAAGDLKQTATIERDDEIGTLATTFNSMTAQLSGLIGSLEERVKARTEQLRASADVGRAAASILDVNQLLDQAVSLIAERFGFYYVAVFMLDAAGEYAVLREATGEAGRILKERGHRLAVDNKSMVGATILTRRARIALDVGKEAIRFANPLLPNTRSEIALPLIVGQRVIGALDVQSERSAAFDDTSAEVLQTMAEQIAVALQNAELFDRADRQARTLTLLNQMSRDLALATTLDRIARITAQAVAQLVGTSHFILTLKSANPELLSVHRVFVDRDPSLGEAQMMPAASTLAGHALDIGRTFHAPHIADDAAQYQDAAVLRSVGVQSIVSVPLRVGDHILGALSVGYSQSTPLTNDQVAELEQVASQMAVALENFNLAEQTRQALSELDAANQRLIGQAWEAYTQRAGQISAEWRGGVWITDRDVRPTDEERGLMANRQHLHRTQVQVSSTSNLQLPIKVRGQTIGEFDIVIGDAPHDWLSDDIAFAQALIDQVGQMIENARLLEETERLAQRERTINTINSRVRQTIDLDAILKTAVNELGQSLKAARVVARIGVPANGGDTSGPEKPSERTLEE